MTAVWPMLNAAGVDPDDLQCWWSNPSAYILWWPCETCHRIHPHRRPCDEDQP